MSQGKIPHLHWMHLMQLFLLICKNQNTFKDIVMMQVATLLISVDTNYIMSLRSVTEVTHLYSQQWEAEYCFCSEQWTIHRSTLLLQHPAVLQENMPSYGIPISTTASLKIFLGDYYEMSCLNVFLMHLAEYMQRQNNLLLKKVLWKPKPEGKHLLGEQSLSTTSFRLSFKILFWK